MHRLLVVDDEIYIADGLCEVLGSVEDLDLDIYKAYSGDEAVLLFDKTRFDIVLTDIRMPGMDGLQLLEKIREMWPKCRVIFLTGYHEFSYVYTAIQHEGVYYLLKTEGYDKVIQMVRKAVSDIEEEWREEAMLQQAKEEAERAKELMRKELLYGVLKGRIDAEEVNQQQFDELDIPLNARKPVLMLLGRVNLLTPCKTYAERMRELYRVRSVARSFIGTHANIVDFSHGQSDLFWLFQPAGPQDGESAGQVKDEWSRLLTFLKGSLELVQNACRESANAELSLVLDDGPVSWAEVSERYAQLNMLLSYRIGRSLGVLLDKNAAKQDLDVLNQQRSKLRVRPAVIDRLAEQLEHGRKEEFSKTLEEALKPLKPLKTMHDVQVQELYYAIALTILSYINRWQLADEAAAAISLHKLMNPDEYESWQEAIDYLHKVSDVLFNLQNQEEERRAHAMVSMIKKHIDNNLHDPDEITLVRLAELAYFNPSYLSRLFKQVTGITLSEYITEARMNRAKRLLSDPDKKIQEVAELVGYGTATNFTRSFRKATNMTPQEYRAAFLNK